MWHHHLDLQSLFLATDHRQGLDLWNSGGPHHLGHEAFSLIWKDINVVVSHNYLYKYRYLCILHSFLFTISRLLKCILDVWGDNYFIRILTNNRLNNVHVKLYFGSGRFYNQELIIITF